MFKNIKYKRGQDKKLLLNKIVLTLVIITLARFGSFIPIPGVDQVYLSSELQNNQIFPLLSSFSQGKFIVLGLFTLGVLPNINASILIQLLIFVFPNLKRLQKEEGELGRQKIIKITRYLTLFIALIYGFLVGLYLKPFVFNWNILQALELALILGVGSLIILFFCEIIDEYGIGNGTSLFIFVNISSSLPNILNKNSYFFATFQSLVYIVIFISSIFFTIIVQNTTRKVSLVSLKRLNDSDLDKVEAYLPFKLNSSGILPLIFASGIMNLILVPIKYYGLAALLNNNFNIIYIFFYFLLILLFGYFYSTILIDPGDIAKDLKKLAFSIPTITPGLSTIKYLETLISRLSILGGFALALVISLPNAIVYLNRDINIISLEGIGNTSLLILVGVTIDLSRQIQTYQISQSYDIIKT